MQLCQLQQAGHALASANASSSGERRPGVEQNLRGQTKAWAGSLWILTLLTCAVHAGPIRWDFEAASELTPFMGDETPLRVGEFGGRLEMLSRYYRPPASAGESNHLFDMWEDQKLEFYTRNSGLTNNHALIINAHGNRHVHRGQARYAVSPHQATMHSGESSPSYSAADLAAYLGMETSRSIQVVFLTGCNDHKALDIGEWREAFPNITTLIHSLPGEVGFQPMVLQVLFNPSSEIQPLFESPERGEDGRMEYFLSAKPTPKAIRMSPYVAQFFRPGESQPYHQQTAGRELIHGLPR